jgi:hypothetical protein
MASEIDSPHLHAKYDFYSSGICPTSQYKKHEITFGEALAKEYWTESPYIFNFGVNQKCEFICKKKLDHAQIQKYNTMSNKGYRYKLSLDDLPSATLHRAGNTTSRPEPEIQYSAGIPVVKFDPVGTRETTIYNHLQFTVEVHETMEGTYRIVGFDVEPLSLSWGYGSPCIGYSDPGFNNTIYDAVEKLGPLLSENDIGVDYTWGIEYKLSNNTWAHRFDHYKKMGDEQVHHVQIMTSIGLSFILSFLVWQLVNRMLGKDYDALARNVEKIARSKKKAN